MKYLLIFFLVVVVFVISITLGAQNDQMVDFNFLIAKGNYQLSTLLAVLFGLGFILSWLICSLFYLRLYVKYKNARRKLKNFQQSEQLNINTPADLITPSAPKE